MYQEQDSNRSDAHGEELQPITPRKTVETFVEIPSGKLSIFEAGIRKEKLSGKNSYGLTDLVAEAGKWHVQLELEDYKDGTLGGALQLKAKAHSAPSNSATPASYERTLIYSGGGTNGFYDANLVAKLSNDELREKAISALRPTQSQIDDYVSHWTPIVEARNLEMLSDRRKPIDAVKERLATASESDKPKLEELIRSLEDLAALAIESSKFDIEHAARTMMVSFRNIEEGLIFRTGFGDGWFKVELGRDLAGKVVSVEIDFERIPEE